MSAAIPPKTLIPTRGPSVESLLLDASPDALFALAADGRILRWNLGAAQLFGYSAEEALGQDLHRLLAPPQRQMESARAVAAALEGGSHREETLRKRRDGGEVLVDSHLCRQSWPGEAPFIAVCERGIGGQRVAETGRGWTGRDRRSQDSARLRREYLTNLSHELRAPLNAIIGFTKLLQAEKVGPLLPPQTLCLSDILNNSYHLLMLINDVLDLAKVESGREQLKVERVDPALLAVELRDLLRALATEKGIELRVEVEVELGVVAINSRMLKQILYNFLSNAIKFTHPGGRVLTRLSAEGEASFRVEVEDNGIGIRAEDIDRLFVEFQQIESPIASASRGTGLGLALSRRLAEAMGGSVGVRSTPGLGSTFWTVLPRDMTQAHPAEAHPAEAHPAEAERVSE